MLNAAEIEAHLRTRSLPAIQALLPPGEFVMPHYDGLGVANLPATVAALLGCDLPGACPTLERGLWTGWGEGLKRIVLVIVDAVGYLQLQAAMAKDDGLVFHRLVEAGSWVPLTSTFPSTTNNVLTTLWTGYSPAAHGILAYELYLRELAVAASTLFFWPVSYRKRDALEEWGIEPDRFVPVPGLAEQLAIEGVTTRAFLSKAYSNSILSRIHSRGVSQVTGFVSGGDMWLGLQRTIERYLHEKLLLVTYWDTVDGITHQYGPGDQTWTHELRGLSWMLEEGFLSQIKPDQREGTLLLITADHGGIETPPASAIRLDDHPALRDMLSLPPVGETRVPFLHTRGDTLAQTQTYMQTHLAESFAMLTRKQVMASGLLGPGPTHSETIHRLGELVGLARRDRYLARGERQLKVIGRHGGLSAHEMLVPLIGVRLDAL